MVVESISWLDGRRSNGWSMCRQRETKRGSKQNGGERERERSRVFRWLVDDLIGWSICCWLIIGGSVVGGFVVTV